MLCFEDMGADWLVGLSENWILVRQWRRLELQNAESGWDEEVVV